MAGNFSIITNGHDHQESNDEKHFDKDDAYLHLTSVHPSQNTKLPANKTKCYSIKKKSILTYTLLSRIHVRRHVDKPSNH